MAESRAVDTTTSSPNPTRPPLTVIQEIELKIARYIQAIIHLKIERNSHLPVSKLPVEVLCRIFEEAQQSCAYDTYRPHGSAFHEGLSWIVVTHVCHYWRDAALNEPSLWTRPILKHGKWASVFLERSRMAGITLAFDYQQSDMGPERMATVISHIPHTATLIINDMRRDSMERVFKHLSSTSAPMLTALTINGRNAELNRTSIFPALSSRHHACIVLPKTALRGAKNLRKVSLHSITIPLTSPLFTRLTDLTLENNAVQTVKPTPTEFLSMLQQNPTLKNLTLRHALPSASSLVDFCYTGPRILLQYLETIRITSDAPSCEFLCRIVALATEIKKMIVTLDYQLNPDRLFYKLRSALDQGSVGDPLGSSWRQATIRGEILYEGSHMIHELTFLVAKKLSTSPLDINDDAPSLFHDSNVAPFEFTLTIRKTNQSAVGISSAVVIVDFFEALDWENLSRLDLHLRTIEEPHLAAILARTFGTLPGLRTVVVEQSCANSLIDALLLRVNWEIYPASYTFIATFPGLQHIQFKNVTFAKGSNTSLGGPVGIDRLLDCLIDRRERSVQIHSVEIKGSVLTKKNHELLAEVVPVVYADSDDYDPYGNDYDYYPEYPENNGDFEAIDDSE